MESSRTPTILDDGMRLAIEHLLVDESPAGMDVTAELASQAVALLRADEYHQPLAGRIAKMLEGSVLGNQCLVSVAHCTAVSFLLGEIAETALPNAVHAGNLAGVFRTHYFAES
ncbi:hypothetical protein [Catenulispora rubra]|uniref:hypothetical protein n=1 Tax=Catenulispora rubra TaxID=280293 RepID=UPI00189285FC|nr:hypothetical protein [Catenulispora rubra]